MAAVDLLAPVQTTFPRRDGQKILERINQILQAKQSFQAGLQAEQEKDIKAANRFYADISGDLPALFVEGCLRRAVLAMTAQQWQAVAEIVSLIQSPKAHYLKGFALVKQGHLLKARSEWNTISDNIKKDRQILDQLIERSKLKYKQAIEAAVNDEQIELAEQRSRHFIQTFGDDDTVQKNLIGHIQPLHLALSWQTKNWAEIYIQSEQTWESSRTIEALRNLAIAAYYRAMTNSNAGRTEQYHHQLITIWSIMIANFDRDRTLGSLPWIHHQEVDLSAAKVQLIQLLEDQIELVKESDLEAYIRLRDAWRCDRQALALLKFVPQKDLQSTQQTWTPNAFKHYAKSQYTAPVSVLAALFTDWGKAVAACLEGDTARALTLRPPRQPVTPIENFAYAVVAYHEGQYCMQNQQWRNAIAAWQSSRNMIHQQAEWKSEIDKLCSQSLEHIPDSEQLEFCTDWYELLHSREATSCLSRCRVANLTEQIIAEKVSLKAAQERMREYLKADPQNPELLDLSHKIAAQIELEQIIRLCELQRTEEALELAEKSQYPEVRNRIAKMLLDIALNGAQRRQINFYQMRELLQQAHQICPDDLEIKEAYHLALNPLTVLNR
jgi:hypothetical protein